MTLARTFAACAALLVVLFGAAGCSTFNSEGRDRYNGLESGPAPTAAKSATPSQRPVEPYDIKPLLHPEKKYLGVAAEGLPESLEPYDDFAKKAGKKPNLVAYYNSFGQDFDGLNAAAVWDRGALPFISWEPSETTLADIAAGKSDAYLRNYARDVRDLNVPVAISLAHEMNGDWYPWGRTKATPEQFVAAWRHVHDVFETVGAKSVIWAWSPNVVNPMPKVKLEPYWPGDAYVDWVGVIGYYAREGATTFDGLFGPTMRQVRTFTKKPFLIPETASQAGERKPADTADLFRGVAAHDDVIGFVWFNYDKETDWRIESGPASLSAFREGATRKVFGFDPSAQR
ncbi:glycosyl hydrolase [Streptomyces sp. T-3]|nr:glycosyl hydrolase [Streptomyces sp. T-3]